MITKVEEKHSRLKFSLSKEDIETFIAEIDPEKKYRNEAGCLQYEIEGYLVLSCYGKSRNIQMERVVIVR